MRGGVSINDLFYIYTEDDLDILRKIIKENIELTRETQLPLL